MRNAALGGVLLPSRNPHLLLLLACREDAQAALDLYLRHVHFDPR